MSSALSFSISKKKLHKILNIAIFILLPLFFMVLGALIFWFYQKKSTEKPLTMSETQAVINPQPAKTPSPAKKTVPSDWQTYKATKLGIKFKYPPGWIVKGPENYIQILNYDPETAPPRGYVPSLDVDYFKIEVVVDKKYSDVDRWFAKRKNEPDPMTDELNEFINIKKITVSSQKGIFFECVSPMTGTKTGSVAFETPDNYLIHFWGALNYEDHKSYYDQILSTVEFLN